MTVLRACVTCGIPSAGSYCPDHEPKPWATSKRRYRRTVSGWEEQRRAKRVLARYVGCCHLCGNPGATEVDHVVPLAEGGADDETNLAPVHEGCHREKTQAEARRARS
jgi:5-methylcytosine-specific restriction enzyme A